MSRVHAVALAISMCAAFAVGRTPAAQPSNSATAPFELPAPTGSYPVGTTSWRITDRSRPETFAGPGEFRQVEVLAWYPAARRRGATAPYLREGLPEVRAFAALFGADTAFDAVKDVRTHAELDAPPAADPRRFPLLVFSHGYTGIPSSYTALLEDLASHGYAVLSVMHPYEATLATLSDGRRVSILDKDGKFPKGVQDVIAEWDTEDATMAAVTRSIDEAEQLRLLRGYLGGLTQTGVALRRWVDDTRLVLDRLPSLPTSTTAGRLAAKLDPGRVGVFGHSMGGVTAGQFCVEDRRCLAGLNLDGSPQSGTMIDASMPRPFLMVYSARPGRLGASDAIYRRAAQPYIRVDVRDTGHLEFSDMVFWDGPLRARPILSAMAPARAVEITRTIVRQYFDQMLRGTPSPLLAGQPVFSEVTVRTQLRAGEIRVVTSGALTAAYQEIVPSFERATGHTVVTAFGGSMGSAPDTIPNRLQRGEPFDVVIMAAPALDDLIRAGKVVAGSRVDLVASSIGMAVRAGAPRPDIGTVEALTRTLLSAKSIAYSSSASGVYLSTELFPRLGIVSAIAGTARRIESEPVGEVVARGEAEIGFQQISELRPVKGIDVVGPLPPGAQRVTVFAAGIVAGAMHPDGARALIAFLASPAAAPAILKSGLSPVASR